MTAQRPLGDGTVRAGVAGVGQMGAHHARVYAQQQGVDLVGVHDRDEDRAAAVAAERETAARDLDDLLDRVDLLSVAVPTEHHYEVARRALDSGVHVLVEKPFVLDLDKGADLLSRARDRGLALQVGHVERFNPAVRTLSDVVRDMEVIAVDASRLGPPVGRQVDGSVALDLMIHDVDVLLGVLAGQDERVVSVQATGTEDNRFVSATLQLSSGMVATLQASRVTREKVRRMAVTARDCKVNVDYIDRSVTIHRHSLPDYVSIDGDVRYRHESVIERPTVANGEPLEAELDSFVDAVRTGRTPDVTGEDGLRALRLVKRIDEAAAGRVVDSPEVLVDEEA